MKILGGSMKITLLALLAFSATSVFANTDYTYCQQNFNMMKMPAKQTKSMMNGLINVDYYNQSSGEYFPFELTADGKIKAHPTLDFKTVDGKEIITSKNQGMDFEVVVSRNEKGEITNVDTTYENLQMGMGMYGGGFGSGETPKKVKKPDFNRKYESNVKLEIKNGKCFPSRIDTVNSIGDESRQDVMFDAKLCKNVNDFFTQNPQAASCFDKGLMDKAKKMFNQYYDDNKDIYGDVDTSDDMMKMPSPMKTKIKSHSMSPMGGFPGMGMGIGMMPMTTEQMLTPFGASIDGVLGANTSGLYGGMGQSPVITATYLKGICEGGGFGTSSAQRSVMNDESLWKDEPIAAASQSQTKSK